jgi:hypothetical protein
LNRHASNSIKKLSEILCLKGRLHLHKNTEKASKGGERKAYTTKQEGRNNEAFTTGPSEEV